MRRRNGERTILIGTADVEKKTGKEIPFSSSSGLKKVHCQCKNKDLYTFCGFYHDKYCNKISEKLRD
jgi:hypothetical protein